MRKTQFVRRGSLLAVLLLASLLFAACTQVPAGSGSTPAGPTPAAQESPTATTEPTTPADTPTAIPDPTAEPSAIPAPKGVDRVKVFLVALEDNGKSGKKIGCNDSLIAAERQIAPTQEPLKAALQELFSIKEQMYGQSGLYNSLYQSDLHVDSIVLQGGKATVNLSGQHLLGGVCDNPRFAGQITETVLQFPTVKEADIFINGTPLEQIVSEKG